MLVQIGFSQQSNVWVVQYFAIFSVIRTNLLIFLFISYKTNEMFLLHIMAKMLMVTQLIFFVILGIF